MLTLNYDKQYDTLHLGLSDGSNAYCADEINNVNIFRDIDSDQITGFVIFGFMEKFQSRSLPLITEPIVIDYESDVIPYINI